MAATSEVVVCPACSRKNRIPAVANGIPRCAHCQTLLPWIADADGGSYDEVVDRSPVPVLVDLWAPWCGPCRMVSPALEKLAGEFAGRMKLAKVNVDEAPSISRRFGVQGIPTLLVTNKGQVVARQTGAAPEGVLRTWLVNALADSERTETG